MKHIIYFVISFFFFASTILAQDGIPPEIMKDYQEKKRLEADLKKARSESADNEVLRGIKIQLMETKEQLERKIEADYQAFTETAMEYLTQKYHEIVEDYGTLASIEVFNEIYGVDEEDDNKKYFEFTGYARTKAFGLIDYEYLLVGDLGVVTHDIIPSSGAWGAGNHLRFTSTALREYDSLLYNGLIWVKKGKVHESAKYDYSRFQSKIPESEDKVIKDFQDTSRTYLIQIKAYREEISKIQQEKRQIEQQVVKLKSMVQNNERKLNIILSGSRAMSETEIVEQYTKEIQEVTGERVEINGIVDIIPAFEELISELVTQGKGLDKDIEVITDKARDLHQQNAKNFFIKSWEKYHVTLDGKVKMEKDWNDKPYLLLVDWAIKK
ncbi:MAG: hypothetical protein R2828_07655 [Saprospiraceae bacterium]